MYKLQNRFIEKNDNYKQITKSLFSEFQVKTEDELRDKLVVESLTVPCIICGKELFSKQVIYFEDDPYCMDCFEGNSEWTS